MDRITVHIRKETIHFNAHTHPCSHPNSYLPSLLPKRMLPDLPSDF